MTIVKNKFGEAAPDIFIGEIKLSYGAESSRERNETKIDNSSTDSDTSFAFTGRKNSSTKDTELSTSSQMRADIQLYLKEVVDTSKETSWFKRGGINNYLKLRVVQCTSPELAKRIIENPTDALPGGSIDSIAATQQTLDGNNANIVVKDIKLSDNNFANLENYRVAGNQNHSLHDIPIETNFHVLTDEPSHLSYFVMSYIDKDLTKPREEKKPTRPRLVGKLSSEVVIDGSRTKKNSAIFTKAGKPYYGPIHQLAGSEIYSTGVKPGIEEGVQLETATVPNIKIKDYRVLQKFDNIKIDFKNNNNIYLDSDDPFYTNLYLNKHKNGSATFIFGIDMFKIFQKNSLYSKIYNSTEKNVSRRLMSDCIIKKIKVVRRRINRELNGINKFGLCQKEKAFPIFNEEPVEHIVATIEDARVGQISDSLNFKSKNTVYDEYHKRNKIIGEIKTINLFSNNSDVVYFQCNDRQLADVTDGIYQYGIEVEIEDRTYISLRAQLNSLAAAIKNYEYYVDTAKRAGYNPDTKKYLNDFVKNANKLIEGTASDNYPWTPLMKEIAITINLFMGHHPRVGVGIIDDLMRTLYSLSCPSSARPGELTVISSFANNLYNNIISTLRNTEDRNILIYSKNSSGLYSNSEKTQSPAIFNLKHYFGDPMSGHSNNNLFSCFVDKSLRNDFGYDYLSMVLDEDKPATTTSDFASFDVGQLKNRFDNEIYRYFTKKNENINIRVNNTTYTNRDFIRSNNYRYVSPSVVSLGRGRQVNLIDEDDNIFNEEKNVTLLLDIMSYNIGKERLNKTEYSNMEFNRTLDNYLSFGGLTRQNKNTQEEESVKEDRRFVSNFINVSRYVGASAKSVRKENCSDNAEVARILNEEYVNHNFEAPGQNPNLARNRLMGSEPVGSNVMLDLIGTSYLKMLEPSKNAKNWNLRNPVNVITFLDKVKGRDVSRNSANNFSLTMRSGEKAEISKNKQSIIKELPFQLKSLLHQGLGKTLRFNFKIGDGAYNPLVDVNKFILFWLMHGQLAELQAFVGNSGERNDMFVNDDLWQPVDSGTWQLINTKTNVLCRLVPYRNKEILGSHPEILNLPIYNQYFLIQGSGASQNADMRPSTNLEASTLELIKKLDFYPNNNVTVEYTTTNMISYIRKNPNTYINTRPDSLNYRGIQRMKDMINKETGEEMLNTLNELRSVEISTNISGGGSSPGSSGGGGGGY